MTPEYKKLVSNLPKPKLAINCVGGDSATDLARALGDGGHLVTYGSVARNAVTVPTSALVSKNITLSGFSYRNWAKNSSPEDIEAMMGELVKVVSEEKLAPCEMQEYKFADFDAALGQALQGHYSTYAYEYFNKKVFVTL